MTSQDQQNGSNPLSPWIGVTLIGVGLSAIVVFAYFKIPEASLAVAVVTAGIMILQAKQNAQVHKDYVVLKNSIRPPTDENQPKTTFTVKPPDNPLRGG
jgi:uncharacterized membrane protein